MTTFAINTGTYFTRVNIWYEHPEKLYSTNYHAGRIIPAGSEVDVFYAKKGRLKFRIKKIGMECMWTHVTRHSSLSFGREFDRVFAVENSFAKTSRQFHAQEKKAIDAGEIVPGMSRKAVLAAYGYPASHMTPDLDDNQWIYWMKRMTTKKVTFENGKVSVIP